MIRGRAYTLPTILSSCVTYWSLLATHSSTTSGVRSLSLVGEQGIHRLELSSPPTDSRPNTVTRAEATILDQVMALILSYTLVDNPLPNLVAFTSQIYRVWGKWLDRISDAVNVKP